MCACSAASANVPLDIICVCACIQVRLLPSFSHEMKGLLLAAVAAVLYTPTDEHFGIVPLEVPLSPELDPAFQQQPLQQVMC